MWTPIRTDDGSYTLAHPTHGEACHSRAGAWTESRERYALACRLRERALLMREERGNSVRVLADDACSLRAHDDDAGTRSVHGDHAGTLRVLDVGTGLGLNLAAALEALEGTGIALDATSLEIDVGVIEATLALGSHASMPDLERHHVHVRAALRQALDKIAISRMNARSSEPSTSARVPLANGHLMLFVGDGRVTLPTLAPSVRFDAVFLDPFSPGVDPPLWEPAFLAEIARRMLPKSLLSTYTAAARARVGLLAAGLHVGPGARVGTKSSGTLASPDLELPPLDSRTTRRLTAKVERLRLSNPTIGSGS